ncbi:MAG TPA: hypothetical protein VGH29_07200 [Candidatus Binataceae bacterium]|jgi:hypothetical protein
MSTLIVIILVIAWFGAALWLLAPLPRPPEPVSQNPRDWRWCGGRRDA